jgi:hypothetical protein
MAAASLTLFRLARFAATFDADLAAAFVTFTLAAVAGAARAAVAVEDFFPAGLATLTADSFLAEEADLASVTVLVGSREPLPVAFLPPVVFAIAILASA